MACPERSEGLGDDHAEPIVRAPIGEQVLSARAMAVAGEGELRRVELSCRVHWAGGSRLELEQISSGADPGAQDAIESLLV
jgi:hypothetical protein